MVAALLKYLSYMDKQFTTALAAAIHEQQVSYDIT